MMILSFDVLTYLAGFQYHVLGFGIGLLVVAMLSAPISDMIREKFPYRCPLCKKWSHWEDTQVCPQCVADTMARNLEEAQLRASWNDFKV